MIENWGDRSALLERLESASEGTDVLDAEIEFLLTGEKLARGWGRKPYPFTRRLESALHLVRPGWRTAYVTQSADFKHWKWIIGVDAYHPDAKASDGVRISRDSVGVGATPALALCLAALRVYG